VFRFGFGWRTFYIRLIRRTEGRRTPNAERRTPNFELRTEPEHERRRENIEA